jgi:23S rRNA (cytidine1920-2'-O)/16S rRNA (cytidine1409-2'-O)-methyltransferase
MKTGQREDLRQRADLLLVARGFFESRAKAQEAIAAGHVSADGRVLRKASETVAPSAEIEATAPYPWVSRGGLKLAAALDHFGFDPHALTCLDIGASTGGFTHVLLDRGAARVHAIDVGHGQLHGKLAQDPRVDAHEGMDARKLTSAFFAQPPRLITCDVSFISLKLILPTVLPLAGPEACLAMLIKPQFEVGPAHVVKGIVKSEEARRQACADVVACVEALGWSVIGLIPSPITGSDGNQEYLLGARSPRAGTALR